MNQKNFIKNELTKAFKKVSKPSYALCGENLCHECEQRHLELEKGREITVDDIASSCYSYIFYEASNFEFLVPILLMRAINKEVDVHDTFPQLFLEELRDKKKHRFFKSYSKEKMLAIINALRFLYDMYFMQEYEFWDYDKEKMVHYFKEEKLEKEIELTLEYWQHLISSENPKECNKQKIIKP